MDAGKLNSGWRAAVRSLSTSLLVAAMAGETAASTDHFISLYGARHSPDRLLDIVQFRASTSDKSRLVAIAWGTPFAQGEHTRLEFEGQYVRHSGLQNHWELNAVMALRWMDFPWDHYVDTRLALGNGLSYASELPPLEPGGEIDEDEASNRWLNYVMVEAEFKPPGTTCWSGFVRIHHRSGIFGAFGGVSGGSNFVGLGLRYYFEAQGAQLDPSEARTGALRTESP